MQRAIRAKNTDSATSALACGVAGTEEVNEGDAERICQADDVEERDIPFASLNSSDVVAVQPRTLCELFLRDL